MNEPASSYPKNKEYTLTAPVILRLRTRAASPEAARQAWDYVMHALFRGCGGAVSVRAAVNLKVIEGDDMSPTIVETE